AAGRVLRATDVCGGGARSRTQRVDLRSVRHARSAGRRRRAGTSMPRHQPRARSLRQAGDPRPAHRALARTHRGARGSGQRLMQALGAPDRGRAGGMEGRRSTPVRGLGGGVLRGRARDVWQRLAGADARGRLLRLVRIHGAVHRGVEPRGARPLLRGGRRAGLRPVTDLQSKVAIVPGGGSGIGRAIAGRFARAGAPVPGVDIAAGGGAAFRCDVSRPPEVLRAFQTIHEELGPPDILVNSAGVAHVGNVEQTSEEDFDRLYAVNVKGVYNCMKAVVPAMKGRGGAILNLASVA